MIIVVANIQVAEGRRNDFLAAFRKIVPTVRAEAGCIEYGPTVDAATELDRQDRDANRVTVVEKWESLAALQAHLTAPHMTEYRQTVQDLVVGSTLQVLEPA